MGIKQIIVVRNDLNMRKGKMIAQGAHASMKWFLDQNKHSSNIEVELTAVQRAWIFGQFTKVVVRCDSEQELLDLIQKAKDYEITVSPIIDCGLTEFNGVDTLTCAAFGPDFSENLDKITGHLKLL